MYSKTILVGNLARDPESRQAGESSVTRLVVAVNDAYSKDKVSYVDVEAWGKLGEICQKYLTKGRQALVEGPSLPRYLGKGRQKAIKALCKS